MYFRMVARKREMAEVATALRLSNAKHSDFKRQIKEWTEG